MYEKVDFFNEVPILCANITDFVTFLKKNSLSQSISLLDFIFSEFDKLCEKFNVYKIHSNNENYNVISIFDDNKKSLAEKTKIIVHLALEMSNFIKKIKSQFDFIDVKIGIHYVNNKNSY